VSLDTAPNHKHFTSAPGSCPPNKLKGDVKVEGVVLPVLEEATETRINGTVDAGDVNRCEGFCPLLELTVDGFGGDKMQLVPPKAYERAIVV